MRTHQFKIPTLESLKTKMQDCDPQFGDWQHLDSKNQAPRYMVIVALLRRFGADGRVLDVGCGEALLRAWLPHYSNYIGVELSPIAARNAQCACGGAGRIVCTPAEDFHAAEEERFDCIAFNEVLYYCADPLDLLSKYTLLLSESGILVISIFQKPESPSQIVRRLFAQAIGSRRPISNRHCTRLVEAHIRVKGWKILEEKSVRTPNTAFNWRIWVVAPFREPGAFSVDSDALPIENDA